MGSHWLFPRPDLSSPRENVPLETTHGLDSSASRNHPPPSVFDGTICNLAGSHWLSLPVEGRQRLVTSLPKLNLSFLDECRTGALGDETVLESMTCEGPTSVTHIAHAACKIGAIEQHSEAKHFDKLNARSTANEVSPGTKVASWWYIASGNEMRDEALSRPLVGTHWLLAEGSFFHTVPELRGSTPAYTPKKTSIGLKPHQFTRATPSYRPIPSSSSKTNQNKDNTVAANADYLNLISRFHRHQIKHSY